MGASSTSRILEGGPGRRASGGGHGKFCSLTACPRSASCRALRCSGPNTEPPRRALGGSPDGGGPWPKRSTHARLVARTRPSRSSACAGRGKSCRACRTWEASSRPPTAPGGVMDHTTDRPAASARADAWTTVPSARRRLNSPLHRLRRRASSSTRRAAAEPSVSARNGRPTTDPGSRPTRSAAARLAATTTPCSSTSSTASETARSTAARRSEASAALGSSTWVFRRQNIPRPPEQLACRLGLTRAAPGCPRLPARGRAPPSGRCSPGPTDGHTSASPPAPCG
ncbi:hypothetical protein HRbin31_00659 [bacterium HR31]|nr:hypothetical protein HRbin31_00659 [bacterium HR31]